MRLSLLALSSALVSIVAIVGCAGSDDGTTGDDAEQRSTERGFEYTCTPSGSASVLDVPSTKVVVTKKHLRYENSYGPNLGAHDPTYRAPRNTARVRYEGFETGDDCTLKVVADEALVEGKPTGQLRIQCSGDDFRQDTLLCNGMRATTLRLPGATPPGPPAPATPPANTRKFTCTTASDSSSLEKTLTMQVTDEAIRINAEFEHTGTRDRDYRARSGNWMQFDNVEYGGDCSMTFVVDGNALTSSNRNTTLKVRCAGDGFQEDRYACTIP